MKKKHSPSQSVLIIGGGFAGLASAALLAQAGYAVKVLEKNEQLGGRAFQKKIKGFTFDMGPSWYTMPEVFERFFAEFGKKPSDFYKLKKLTPQYRVFFGDNTFVDITGNYEKDRALFESFEVGAAKQLDRYVAESKVKYDIALNSILYKNMSSLWDLISWDIIKNSLKMGVLQSLHSYVSSFFKHPKLQQILEYNVVFLGCSPQKAPALFTLMAHLDFGGGIWYPKGGLYSVVESLKKLGESLGVEYLCNSPVTSIQTTGNTITQVNTATKSFQADHVIAAADYKHIEDLLSDQSKRNYEPSYWDTKVLAPSAFLIYLGLDKRYPKIKHHSLYFGDDWKKHFDTVFDHPQWPTEPSIYINKPSDSDTSMAPKGCENLMILVPVAPGLEESEAWRQAYCDFLISFIEEKLHVKLKGHIIHKEIFSVSDFATRYNSFKGNALGGLAHTLFQSAIWRPVNKSKHLHNLYFAGANTVPGIGVPTALISAHLVRDLIQKSSR